MRFYNGIIVEKNEGMAYISWIIGLMSAAYFCVNFFLLSKKLVRKGFKN